MFRRWRKLRSENGLFSVSLATAQLIIGEYFANHTIGYIEDRNGIQVKVSSMYSAEDRESSTQHIEKRLTHGREKVGRMKSRGLKKRCLML